MGFIPWWPQCRFVTSLPRPQHWEYDCQSGSEPGVNWHHSTQRLCHSEMAGVITESLYHHTFCRQCTDASVWVNISSDKLWISCGQISDTGQWPFKKTIIKETLLKSLKPTADTVLIRLACFFFCGNAIFDKGPLKVLYNYVALFNKQCHNLNWGGDV